MSGFRKQIDPEVYFSSIEILICEHDILYVVGIPYEEISEEDRKRLEELSFNWNVEDECWYSFRFGFC